MEADGPYKFGPSKFGDKGGVCTSGVHGGVKQQHIFPHGTTSERIIERRRLNVQWLQSMSMEILYLTLQGYAMQQCIAQSV